MTSDTNFDCIAKKFEKSIYGSSKGYIRLNVLWDDLLSGIPDISEGGLYILDAGGGAGHIARLFAKLGNRVVLSDASRAMLDIAAEAVRQEALSDKVTIIHSTIQDLDKLINEKFDLITCHAVLEWVSHPKYVLEHLPKFLESNGNMSVMFYNRNAAILKGIIKGGFGSTPTSFEIPKPIEPNKPIPLNEQDVRNWLNEQGFLVVSKAGIRIFHDLLELTNREQYLKDSLEDLLRLEKQFKGQEPFASIAQHIHLICRRMVPN